MSLRVALLWSGDRSAPDAGNLASNRLRGVAQALRAVGIDVTGAVYSDERVDAVRTQLQSVDGVLVWVNPIEHGRDRSVLNALLRQIADQGVYVSAHPDVIDRMGTKEVLFRTRDMSWGSDTRLYATFEALRNELPLRLREGRPRVLKQCRGNGGNGVWKIEPHPTDSELVCVRHALRGSVEEDVRVEAFLGRCTSYFDGSGCIVDQPYQDRLTDGMIRCYLVEDQVVGFGHQAINALFPAPPGAARTQAPEPGPRLYHPTSQPEFQPIKQRMHDEWLDALCRVLDIDRSRLPMIWDADLLYGPKTASGEDTYVLCEINVSSVFPFPDAALESLARAVKQRLSA